MSVKSMPETTTYIYFWESSFIFDKVREVRVKMPHTPTAYRADVLKVLKDDPV